MPVRQTPTAAPQQDAFEVPTMTQLKAYLHDIETTLEHMLADFALMSA
ncbi:hypothetical protein [Pandoraea apista]|uniref:Uncharacterized protein n=1 Tax=Pandoraea apista TaxID=93218 RepID=A0A5E5PEB1_9BURK|nr:hypothetical protein [Pandoraea apista]CFB62692.1 hypothetical protein LMG16407_02765 [Pandoraea apista]VVG73969.1 hypothetical protein PAP18089_04980 [Pandoraea apista]